MSSHPAFPPLDGSIPVLPGFVDFQAEHNPDRPWAIFPSGDHVESISFKQFSDATHRAARAFRPGGSLAKGEVVAVIALCDSMLYIALVTGLVRAGYVVSETYFSSRIEVTSGLKSVSAIPSIAEKFRCSACEHDGEVWVPPCYLSAGVRASHL